MSQLGKYSNTDVGKTMALIQLFYAIALLPISIIFFILRKKQIGKGLLFSFFICFIIAGGVCLMGT
jgi:hypothetical protein